MCSGFICWRLLHALPTAVVAVTSQGFHFTELCDGRVDGGVTNGLVDYETTVSIYLVQKDNLKFLCPCVSECWCLVSAGRNPRPCWWDYPGTLSRVEACLLLTNGTLPAAPALSGGGTNALQSTLLGGRLCACVGTYRDTCVGKTNLLSLCCV